MQNGLKLKCSFMALEILEADHMKTLTVVTAHGAAPATSGIFSLSSTSS